MPMYVMEACGDGEMIRQEVPLFAKLAATAFLPPVSAAAPEQVNSIGGRFDTPHRGSMDVDTLATLVNINCYAAFRLAHGWSARQVRERLVQRAAEAADVVKRDTAGGAAAGGAASAFAAQ